MLSLPNKDLEIVLKYLHDKYPGHYDDMTIDKLRLQPYYKQIWVWWQALAFNGHKGTWFVKLEDAPDGIEWITVVDKKYENYKWKDGMYVKVQEITEEGCKAHYEE